MLFWSILFFIFALLSATLGFTTLAGASYGIAKILFVIFVIIFIASLVFGRRGLP